MLWFVLMVLASALWWWPLIIEPNLDLPWWCPLALVALSTGLEAVLSVERWRHFVIASAIGAFAGVWSGYAIWPLDTAHDYLQSVQATVVLDTVVAAVVSLVMAQATRKLSLSNQNGRRAVLLALACCVAFGPIALALTPSLVANRVKRNNLLAAERFASLKSAVERTLAETGDPQRICDGLALKRHYSGPPFSQEDWDRITGNYVKQDGYFFMIYCHEKAGYTIAQARLVEKPMACADSAPMNHAQFLAGWGGIVHATPA